MSLTIRSAEPSDQAVITQFNLDLAMQTESLALDKDVVQKGVAAILGDQSKGFYTVAESAEEIVGQVMVTYEWSDWRNGNIWWLQSVYVQPRWRGKGVFSALLQHLREAAETRPDVCGIRLYMHETNSQANKVYNQLGFSHTGYQVFEMPLKGSIEAEHAG
jgi:GNAT superfamily N-acetyltransferase